jgi:hypothetical protein
MSHKKCVHDTMEKIMKEYENKKLLLRNKMIVTDRKQALAIGLSKVQNECTFNKEETTDLLFKVEKDLNNMKKKIILSNLIELKQLLVIFNKKKKTKYIKLLKNLLWDKITSQYRHGILIDKNMWDEIEKINNI